MRRLALPSLTGLLLALLLSGCATHIQKGDDFAKHGDWEHALAEYTRAADAHPDDHDLAEKRDHARHEVALSWTKQGEDAFAAGKIADAGEWWRRAIQLDPADHGPKSAWTLTASHDAPLEQAGDQAVTDKRFEDAIHCFGPLLMVFPERAPLAEKDADAHRLYAGALDGQASDLAKKDLLGAALLVDLEAVHNDPMHPTAYSHSETFRKAILAKTLVSLPAATFDDGGWPGFASVLAPYINTRLGEYPPYGPSKNASAIPAVLSVTVEDFSWWDSTEHLLEPHDGGGEGGKAKVPNPQRQAQQRLVAALSADLKRMQAGAVLDSAPSTPWIAVGGPEATPTPAPSSRSKKTKGAPAAKPVAASPSRKPLTARPATAEEIQKKQDDLIRATADLEAMPEEITASQAVLHYYALAANTTRTVKAKIRLELREPDFEKPVVKEQEMTWQVTQHSSEANPERGLAAVALKLPTVEQMIDPLAEKFADAVDVIKEARDRRAQRLLDQGRARHAAGADDDALDAYVRAMFILGFAGLPEDATSLVVSRMDGVDPKQLVSGP